MTHDVIRVFADIDADHGDRCIEFLRHGVLLVLSAPCQLLVLAGPEHGRTIPLADMRPTGGVPHLTTSPVAPDNSIGRRADAYCQSGSSNWAGKGTLSRRRPRSCRSPRRYRP